MAVYNSAISVLKGIRTEFAVAISKYEPMFKVISEQVKSDSNLEDYKFWDSFPRIKEWIDTITKEKFKEFLYQIRNKSWQFSIPVDRDTLSDSKTTIGSNVELQIKQAVNQWKDFPDELIYDLLIDNGECYDGSNFFATSHNIDGDNAIDNLKTGTQTGTYTLAQFEADMKTAKKAISGYRDKNDRPINKAPKFLAVIPPHLEDQALTLRNSQEIYVSGTKSNILESTFDILINYWQGESDYDWYLVNQGGVILPFISQMREKPNWKKDDDEKAKDILYYSTARMAAGYGLFTSICKINN
jgi:phage major head subunit gpT-like protein